MNRKILTFLFVAAAGLALAIGSSFITAPVDAGGCTACGGATRTVYGYGSGNSCSEALGAAESDAIQKSFAGAPACVPCQTSTGAQACAVPSCYPGACPPNSFHGTFTLNYKCKSCDLGPEIPQM